MPNNSNGREIKILEKVVLLIAILGAIIGPWLLHDRAITRLETKIDTLTESIGQLKGIMNSHILGVPYPDPDSLPKKNG